MTEPRTASLLAQWRDQLDAIVADCLPGSGPVALVNFPNHANAGDDAVWLGAEAVLARLGRPVRYRASWGAYHPDALRAAHPEGPILVNGGGNLGDVYARQQGVRERLLVDFPDRAVLQLPQSIWFRDDARRAAFAGLVADHGRFTLLVRDRPSLEAASALGAARVELCPDLALGLPPVPRPAPVTVDVVWCGRHDPEATVDQRPPTDAEVSVVDWGQPIPGEPPPPRSVRWRQRVDRWGTDWIGSHPRQRLAPRVVGAGYDTLARHWVDRGLALLAPGRVVVTERLHAHVFCLWMGIPHVTLETANGKIGALVDAWTGASPLVYRAGDPVEALALARSLVAADHP